MRSSAWLEVPLGSHCEIFSGYPFKSNRFTNDPDDIPLVKGENLGQGEVLWDISKRWPKEEALDLQRFKLIAGDVVLAMDRPWVPAGLKFARIPQGAPEALLVQRVARLRALKKLDQKFLGQLIASSQFVAYIQNISRGVGVPHISAKEIGAFKFQLPPLGIQRDVGDLLTSYDDLIENNRCRINMLEKSACLLYREWFVSLRFPGHERSKFANGIPQGWKKEKLSNIAIVNERNLGARHDGDIDYIDIASVSPGSINEIARYRFSEAPGRARRIVRHGDIIWSCVRPNRRSHALVWQPPDTLIASTGFAVITPKVLPSSFLYQALTTDSFVGYLEKRAKGAAYPAVVAGDFEEAEVLTPSDALAQSYDEFAMPLLDQLHNLRSQSIKLRAARDLLLPRLMSGEISV